MSSKLPPPLFPFPSQSSSSSLPTNTNKQKKSTSASPNKQKEEPLIPPIQPFSPQEISKFTALDLALRSHHELAREGASLLNPRALAKLVHGIKKFQDTHLGKTSKYTSTSSWPITKLPDIIFRSRSSNGPLYTLLLTSYNIKKEYNWKTFDFVSMNRYNDNILLLTHIEQALIKEGWLVRPVCYFDTSVSKKKVIEYTKIITKFGGVVVDEYNGVLDSSTPPLKKVENDKEEAMSVNGSGASASTGGKKKKRKKNSKQNMKKQPPQVQQQVQPTVTHVIAWDEEEHDSKSTLLQEVESASASNNDIVDKLYLRTIAIIDPKKQKSSNSNIVETNMMETKKKGGRLGGKGRKGKSPNDPHNDPLLDINTPMAFVHWWYLPNSYDEFMLASDVDGDDNDVPPKPDGGPWVMGCKFIRDVEKFNEWGLEADYAITDFEKKVTLYKVLAKKKLEEAKRLREEEELAKKTKSKERRKSKSPILRIRVSCNKSATAAGADRRQGKSGMNQRQIFTGYYAGENTRSKIRRLVYDGALCVPKEASTLVHETMKQMMTTKSSEQLMQMNYDLPKVGSVLRPSEDPKLLSCSSLFNDIDNGRKDGSSSGGGGFFITELRSGISGTTAITNRRCVAKDPVIFDSTPLPRIRGGGDEGGKEKIDSDGIKENPNNSTSQDIKLEQNEDRILESHKKNSKENADTAVPPTSSTEEVKINASEEDQKMEEDPPNPITNYEDKTDAIDVDDKQELEQSINQIAKDSESMKVGTDASETVAIKTQLASSFVIEVETKEASTLTGASQSGGVQVTDEAKSSLQSEKSPIEPQQVPTSSTSLTQEKVGEDYKNTVKAAATISTQENQDIVKAIANPQSTTSAILSIQEKAVPENLKAAKVIADPLSYVPSEATKPGIVQTQEKAAPENLKAAKVIADTQSLVPSISGKLAIVSAQENQNVAKAIADPRSLVPSVATTPAIVSTQESQKVVQAIADPPSIVPPVSTKPAIFSTQEKAAQECQNSAKAICDPQSVIVPAATKPVKVSTQEKAVQENPKSEEAIAAPEPLVPSVAKKLVTVSTQEKAAEENQNTLKALVDPQSSALPVSTKPATLSTQEKIVQENQKAAKAIPAPQSVEPSVSAKLAIVSTQERVVQENQNAVKSIAAPQSVEPSVSSNKEDKPENISSTSKPDTEPAPKKTKSQSAPPAIAALKCANVSKGDKDVRHPFRGDQEPTSESPSWYDSRGVSSLEKNLLPEWFDQTSDHRTQESYIIAREGIIEVASRSTNKYVTGTAVRRCVPGDAGSLLRLHQFLISWGFINGSAIGDAAPTIAIRGVKNLSSSNSTTSTAKIIKEQWSGDMLNILAISVASFATKKRKRGDEGGDDMMIDWKEVAEKVGRNVTPLACYRTFLSTNFDAIKPAIVNQMDGEVEADDATEITIDNDSSEGREDLISHIIDGVRPSVVQAAINVAFHATAGNISETQKVGLVTAVANKAAERAKEEEDKVSRILQEILDQRMSKMENRLALLDDLECMFDAERMALELERRDLYTLRCRHWFSGDS